jgi:hypothetical protein
MVLTPIVTSTQIQTLEKLLDTIPKLQRIVTIIGDGLPGIDGTPVPLTATQLQTAIANLKRIFATLNTAIQAL